MIVRSLIARFLIAKIGYYSPSVIIRSVIMTIRAGPTYTFKIDP